MPLAYMNAHPPTISCSAASLTCRSSCSVDAATFTTQMSKPAMNMASSTTGSISQRREPGGDAVSVTTLPQQLVVTDGHFGRPWNSPRHGGQDRPAWSHPAVPVMPLNARRCDAAAQAGGTHLPGRSGGRREHGPGREDPAGPVLRSLV